MAKRAQQCGAFGAEVENIEWGEQRYYDLQTRVIESERKILLRVNLGRNECDETLIAKALGLRCAEPEPEPEPELSTYTCVENSHIRSGFNTDSAKVGMLAAGEVVAVIDKRLNDEGILRVQFGRGWVSEKTATGVVCLKPGAAATEPAAEPEPDTEVTGSVQE